MKRTKENRLEHLTNRERQATSEFYDIYLSTRVWNRAHWTRLQNLQTLLYQNICRDGINLLELMGLEAPDV